MQNRLTMLFAVALVTLPVVTAQAFDLEQALRDVQPDIEETTRPEFRISQNGGKSLADCVEQVRRKTNGRIISAETRNKGDREVHHVKFLTKDGKVKTQKCQGRKRGNG